MLPRSSCIYFLFFYILVLPQIQNRSTPLLSLFSIFYLLYNRTALLFPHPFLCCFFRIFSVFPLPATKYNLVIPAYTIFFLCPSFLPPYRLATPSFLYSPFSLYHFPAAIYSRTLLFLRLFIFILRHPYNRTNLSFLPLFSLSFFPPPAEITPLCYSCIYLLFSL